MNVLKFFIDSQCSHYSSLELNLYGGLECLLGKWFLQFLSRYNWKTKAKMVEIIFEGILNCPADTSKPDISNPILEKNLWTGGRRRVRDELAFLVEYLLSILSSIQHSYYL